MIVTVEYKKGQKLTEEQIAEIEAAKKMPVVYDEDCPELTPAMEKAFLLAAFREVDEMKRGGSGRRFQDPDALWASLEE